MTDFLENPRFPDNIAYGASSESLFNTDFVINQSGFSQVNINWDIPLFRADVSHGVKTIEDITKLKKFFYQVKGRAIGFRFKDWLDFRVIKEESAVNDGEPLTSNVLKLCKVYVLDGATPSYRRITKPVNSALYPENTVLPFKLYRNSILVNSYDYTIDYTTGIVTLDNDFTYQSNDVFTFECEFDIPVRFTTDSFKANIESFNSYSWGSITVQEMRELQ